MKRIFMLVAGAALAASTATAQQVPVRDLTPIEFKSADNFGAILGVRQVTSKQVIVNDAGRRQLLMLDSTLSRRSVLIDSTTGAANSYGAIGSSLIPYLGDSSLFVDVASLSLLVIDGQGKVARVMAAPRPADLRFLRSSPAAIDNQGRLLYRGPMMVSASAPSQGPAVPGAKIALPAIPDSSALLRADFETRNVDTVGKVKQPNGMRPQISQGANGPQIKMTINPLTTTDEWAVLSDGSVALVRGHDYHIDWIHPDGSTSSSAKLPFDWKRLTDEDKQKLIDSARTDQETSRAKAAEDAKKGGAGAAGAQQAMVATEMAAAKGAMAGGGGGGGSMVFVRGGDGGGGGGGAEKMPMVMGSGPGGMMAMQTDFVPLNEIADFWPAIRPGAAKADMDGNLWILPTTSAQSQNGELVYDVVNNKGTLTERVRIPQGRSIAGFGRGGVVYLMSGDRTSGFYLERARVLGGKRVTQ